MINRYPLADLSQMAAATEAAADAAEASIVGNAILSFVGAMDDQAKEDVRNSYLFASLAATHRYPFNSDGEAWYDMFCTVMQEMGWLFVTRSYRQSYSSDTTYSMDKIAIDILQTSIASALLPGATALNVLKTATSSVAALKTDPVTSNFFDQQVRQSEGANFAVGSTTYNEGGDIIMALGTVTFNTEINVTSVLFTHLNSADVKAHHGNATLILNQSVYSSARAHVLAELGSRALNSVKKYSLGN